MRSQMTDKIDRRTCMRDLGVGLLLGAIAASRTSTAAAPGLSSQAVRIGVVGLGPRGYELLRLLLAEFSHVTVPALCELKPELLDAGLKLVNDVRGTPSRGYCRGEYEYREMFDRDDLDGILVATGVQKLARIAADAMNAGKHVATEVTGPYTLDDCWNLVETKERTGKRYMLLEQCCYGDQNLMVLNMLRQRVFKEPYYAECSYIHDVYNLLFNTDQSLTWRGRMMVDGHGSSYPAHGIASVAKWLGINDGDRFDYCTAMMTEPREIHARAVDEFGADSDAARIDFRTGDFLTTLIKTVGGKMIRLDYSLSNTRPYSRYYLLQTMNGCYDSRAGLFVDDAQAHPRHDMDENWADIETYLDKYRHPFWHNDGAHAAQYAGHGGMDYFCLRDFVEMVRHDREPWVDCYDAASWGALNHCSQLSIDRKGAPVEIPDFTMGRWKDPGWRADRVSPVSALAG
jgi:predicted dehydrogenase